MQQIVTTIHGERVRLRPFQEGDAEESARVWTPESTHMYGGSLREARRPSVAGRRHEHEQIVASGEHHFAIEADGRYIGWLGLRVNDADQSARYRIGIADPDYWGRGYGTEVTRLALHYALNTLQLHRVHLRVAAYNTRAIRCYEKCGFRVEGRERESFQVDGEWQDDVLMAILREEWEKLVATPSSPFGELTIRGYRASDYPQVREIWETAGWGDRPGSSEAAITYKVQHTAGPFLVAEADGQVVGTAIVTWDGRWGWVSAVAVSPAHQRQGIARRLMAQAERALAELGAHQACLLVNRSDPAAMALYESLGYESFEFVVYLRKKLQLEETGACGH